MASNSLFFQYCQKIVLFSADKTNVLLAKRKDEADYDGVFSFIGGKLETTDQAIIAGLKREKDEEIGTSARIRICPTFSYNVHFVKKDGSSMILPHYAAHFIGGTIVLSDEYAEYAWVPLAKLDQFEPKIANVPEMTIAMRRLLMVLTAADFVEI